MASRIHSHFISKIMTGILVWVPVYVTFRCIAFFFQLTGISFVATIGLILFFHLTGWLVLGRYSKLMLKGLLASLARLPILSWVFFPLYHWMDAVVFEGGRIVNKLTLIQYPMQGAWTIGCILKPMRLHGVDYSTVFIPTLVNPLTGYTTFAPKEFIYETPMSYGDGVKMLMSLGVLSPERVF